MATLDHVVRQGKALYAGLSSYSPKQTRQAARLLRELGTPCLIHQPRWPVRSLDRTGLAGGVDREASAAS